MNDTPTRITGKKPDEAIELENVGLKEKHYKRLVGLDEKRLPDPFVKVRYLFNPGEYEGRERRATDPVWSLEVFDLKRSIVEAGQPVLYYLSEGSPKRGFVRPELQVIPEDT